jgi:hypothetical protein
MSDSVAIAAITARLHALLDRELKNDFDDITVTVRPLDRARENVEGHQVNLFLYHTLPNAAWRNMDVPWRVKPGERGQMPLALDLYYLLTAYGPNDDEIDTSTNSNRLLGAHRLLGHAMSLLHDNTIFDADAINAILPAQDQLDHPYDQVEHVRINPQPLSVEDISKLWAGFQVEYRLSVAYQVGVVLIESGRPVDAALPVLRRGSEDRGGYVLPSLSPILYELQMPHRKPGAELGDTLTILGDQLDSGDLTVRFSHPLLAVPLERAPLPGGTAMEMQVKLPDAGDDPETPSKWPAGFYTLSLVVQHPGLPAWTTNGLPFALSPQVANVNPATAAQGDLPLTLTMTCTPQIRSEQRAVLLFGRREIPAQTVTTPSDPTAPTTLTFSVDEAEPGEYVLRLRVDGVDSIPVVFAPPAPPEFAADQKVTITP